MNDKRPLVSIITPSFNQGRFIEDSILSVKNQDYSNIEHIIVDGGSTDSTLEVIKKYNGTYNMCWVSEADDGQSDAINKGFDMAKGDIIGWINSDDAYFDIAAISTVVQYFREYEDADVIYGNCVRIDENNRILYRLKSKKFDAKYLRKVCFFEQPAVFFRRNITDRYRLDTSLNYCMDYEFWVRISKNHEFKYVNRVLAVDRTHSERKTVTGVGPLVKEARARVSKEYDRRSLLEHILDKSAYPIYSLGGIRNLDSKYTFAFDIEKDNFVVVALRHIIYMMRGAPNQ